MAFILTNWKTSLTAVLIVTLACLHTFLGITIPGFSLDMGSAIVMALGFFNAKDNNVTGGSVPNAVEHP